MIDPINNPQPRMKGRFQFGAFQVDLATAELRRAGVQVRISRQLLGLLGWMVSQPGVLLPRRALQDLLWHGSVADVETSLNTAIFRLRRILQDTASQPLFIETVGRRGYRFIAPVQRITARNRAPQADFAAREAFLLGRHLTWNTLTADGLQAAIHCFEEAIAAAPDFAGAHAGLAQACQLLGAAGVDEQPLAKLLPRAKAAARAAIDLDDELADGYAALGIIQMEFEGDFRSAAGSLSQALDLEPNHMEAHVWFSQLHALTGQNELACELAHRAAQLDPASPFALANLVFLTLAAGREADALSYAARMIMLHPNDWLAQSLAGSALLANGRLERALLRFERSVALAPDSLAARSRLGAAYGICGREGDAREVLAHLQQRALTTPVPAMLFARIHGALGEKNRCVDLLVRARAENNAELVWLAADRSFHPLRAQVSG